MGAGQYASAPSTLLRVLKLITRLADNYGMVCFLTGLRPAHPKAAYPLPNHHTLPHPTSSDGVHT